MGTIRLIASLNAKSKCRLLGFRRGLEATELNAERGVKTLTVMEVSR